MAIKPDTFERRHNLPGYWLSTWTS